MKIFYVELMLLVAFISILIQNVLARKENSEEPYTFTEKDFKEFFPEHPNNGEKFNLQPSISLDEFNLDELLKPSLKENNENSNKDEETDFNFDDEDDFESSKDGDKEEEEDPERQEYREASTEKSGMSPSNSNYYMNYNAPEHGQYPSAFDQNQNEFDENSPLNHLGDQPDWSPHHQTSYNEGGFNSNPSLEPSYKPSFSSNPGSVTHTFNENSLPTASRDPYLKPSSGGFNPIGSYNHGTSHIPSGPRHYYVRKNPNSHEPSLILKTRKLPYYHPGVSLSPQKKPLLSEPPKSNFYTPKGASEYTQYSSKEYNPPAHHHSFGSQQFHPSQPASAFGSHSYQPSLGSKTPTYHPSEGFRPQPYQPTISFGPKSYHAATDISTQPQNPLGVSRSQSFQPAKDFRSQPHQQSQGFGLQPYHPYSGSAAEHQQDPGLKPKVAHSGPPQKPGFSLGGSVVGRPPVQHYVFKHMDTPSNYPISELSGVKAPPRPPYEEPPPHYPRYKYQYFVNDPLTKDIKSQWELRDGDLVNGAYSLVEPDGALRIVEYTADKDRGFRALVKRIHQNYPASPPKHPSFY